MEKDNSKIWYITYIKNSYGLVQEETVDYEKICELLEDARDSRRLVIDCSRPLFRLSIEAKHRYLVFWPGGQYELKKGFELIDVLKDVFKSDSKNVFISKVYPSYMGGFCKELTDEDCNSFFEELLPETLF